MALTDCGGGKFGDHFRVARATAGCRTPEVAVRRGREMIRNTPHRKLERTSPQLPLNKHKTRPTMLSHALSIMHPHVSETTKD